MTKKYELLKNTRLLNFERKKNILRTYHVLCNDHTEIVVAFFVVNFVGCLVITRYHEVEFRRKQDNVFPTSLPDLSTPSRALKNLRKSKMLEIKSFRTQKNSNK